MKSQTKSIAYFFKPVETKIIKLSVEQEDGSYIDGYHQILKNEQTESYSVQHSPGREDVYTSPIKKFLGIHVLEIEYQEDFITSSSPSQPTIPAESHVLHKKFTFDTTQNIDSNIIDSFGILQNKELFDLDEDNLAQFEYYRF